MRATPIVGLLLLSVPALAAASGRGEAYAIVDGEHVLGANLSDDHADWERVRRLSDTPFIYVERGERTYLIRDPALVAEARASFAPAEQLGARQAELGTEQAKLGSQQAELGGKQATLGVREANLTPDGADVRAERERLRRDRTELERQQRQLGRKQEALGKQQRKLGDQQREAMARAEAAFRSLVDRALAAGKAERIERR